MLLEFEAIWDQKHILNVKIDYSYQQCWFVGKKVVISPIWYLNSLAREQYGQFSSNRKNGLLLWELALEGNNDPLWSHMVAADAKVIISKQNAFGP